MTQPQDSPQVFEGTDISVEPEELKAKEATPATSDPEQMTGGDDELGGTGGENAGGAG
jgi:hypothetical protein